MAKLTTEQRKRMPGSEFALPGKEYPIEDEEHGRKAIQLGKRAENAGTLSPSEYAEVKDKVHDRYPDIGSKSPAGKAVAAHRQKRAKKER
jgi:hypothetical protein